MNYHLIRRIQRSFDQLWTEYQDAVAADCRERQEPGLLHAKLTLYLGSVPIASFGASSTAHVDLDSVDTKDKP